MAQESAPARENGVDYSGPGMVIVRTPRYRLVWRKGRTYYSGTLHPSVYAKACLQVIPYPGIKESCGNYILEGGKLTKGRLEAALVAIRAALDEPELLAEHLDPKRTFVTH